MLLLALFISVSISTHALNPLLNNLLETPKIGVCYPQKDEGSFTLTCQKLCDNDECDKQVVASHYANDDCSGIPDYVDPSTYATHPYTCDSDHHFIRRSLVSSSTSLCSALRASVVIRTRTTTQQGNSTTSESSVLSAQALFPPHSYHVDWTDVVYLSDTDDICDANTPLSTNVTAKVVLLYEAIGSCSVHSKVLTAEANGAAAVLISNDDSTGMVQSIADDDTVSTQPTIPTRSISKLDADYLRDNIVLNIYDEVKAFIGCFADANTSYPSVLCVTEARVNLSHAIRGEFQRQMDITHSGHPVWKLEEYTFWTRPLYMFLHDAYGNSAWLWTITWDSDMVDDTAVYLRCSAGTQGNTSIDDPTLCPSWVSPDGLYTAQMNITGTVCPVVSVQNTSSICIHSESDLGGVRGTYHLLMSGYMEWGRALSDCDSKSAILTYVSNAGTFSLHVETREYSAKAVCTFEGSQLENGGAERLAYRPDLCVVWKVRGDTHYVYTRDDSLSVTIGACADASQCVVSDAPDALCVANNSMVHGSLMGEYVRLNERGPHWNSPIYKREPPPDAPWLDNTLYIWYANEYYASKSSSSIYNIHYTRYWVLSPYNVTETVTNANSITKYGYCFGYASGNPVNCANWIFTAEGGAPLWDEPITVREGACGDDLWPPLPDSWPQYVCVGLRNAGVNSADTKSLSHLPVASITGAYVRDTNAVDDARPIWRKPRNDFTDNTLFLRYDAAVWQIGTSQSNGNLMVCDPYYKSNTLNPVDCTRWMNGDSIIMDNIYLYECTAGGVPDLCLSQDDGTVSSFLGGTYESSAQLADDYNTMEFLKRDPVEGFDLYVWYHDSKWVISLLEYTVFEEANQGSIAIEHVFGYCTGGETSDLLPVCEDCWVFYVNPAPLGCGEECPSVVDCAFTISTDVSSCEEGIYTYIRWPDFAETLCAEGASDYAGTYATEDADAPVGYGGRYVATADGNRRTTLLTYNHMSNKWQFKGLAYELVCDSIQLEDINALIPVECMADALEEDVTVSMGACNKQSEAKKDNGGEVAAVVIGIMLGVICIAVVIVVVVKRKGERRRDGKDVEEREMIGNKKDDNALRASTSSPHKLATFDDDLCAPDVEEEDDIDQEDDADPLNEP